MPGCQTSGLQETLGVFLGRLTLHKLKVVPPPYRTRERHTNESFTRNLGLRGLPDFRQ